MENRTLPNRKSVRLKNYDYSLPGYYYVTICTQKRKFLFGDISGDKMILNDAGKIVNHVWKTLPRHHHVALSAFQIMPNHVHCIIQIVVGATRGSPVTRGLPLAKTGGSRPTSETGGSRPTSETGGSRPAPTTATLGTVVGLFKSECTKQIRRQLHRPNLVIWQRNYYENIVRTDADLLKIRNYIKNNLQMWERDRNNPQNWKKYGS
ncbi:transposase [Patescibacteria group bacterium]